VSINSLEESNTEKIRKILEDINNKEKELEVNKGDVNYNIIELDALNASKAAKEKHLTNQIEYSQWNPMRYVWITSESTEEYFKRDSAWTNQKKNISKVNQIISGFKCDQIKIEENIKILKDELNLRKKAHEQRAKEKEKLETLLSEISKERDKIDAEIVEVLKTWQVGEKAAIAFKDTIKISYVLISVMELQNTVFTQWSAGLNEMKERIQTTNEVIEINTVRNKMETDLKPTSHRDTNNRLCLSWVYELQQKRERK